MKRRLLYSAMIVTACLFLLCLIMFVFNSEKQQFGAAAGLFGVAEFMLFEMKNAYTPYKRNIFNPTKAMFHQWGKPNIYWCLCLLLFLLFSGLGVLQLI